MRKKIYFRADAGADIGYGHFIRSLALADMLKSDFECVMFTQEPTLYQINEAANVCQLVSLPADESRFDKFLTYLTGDEIVVLDNYFYTTEYQHQIKDMKCRLICINDMPHWPFYCDAIICPDPLPKEYFILEKEISLHIGFDWTLLRRPFRELAGAYYKHNQNRIVICFGGSDQYQLTELYTQLILKYSNCEIDTIVGPNTVFNVNDPRVCIHRGIDAKQMAHLFLNAQMGIFSASTICNEVLAIGLPFAVGYYMDNQHQLYKYLVNNQLGYPLGNLLEDSQQKVKELCSSSLRQALFLAIDYVHLKERFVKMFNQYVE